MNSAEIQNFKSPAEYFWHCLPVSASSAFVALIRDTRTVQTASGTVQRQSVWIDDSGLSFLSRRDNGRDILQMLFQAIGTKHFLRYLDFLYMSAALLTNSRTQIDQKY